jgi:hypothetical protein
VQSSDWETKNGWKRSASSRFDCSIQLATEGHESIVVIDMHVAVLRNEIDSVLAEVVANFAAISARRNLGTMIFAAWIARLTALLLWNADQHVHALWLAAWVARIWLPAWVDNLNDLRLGARSNVIVIRNLNCMEQLNRAAISDGLQAICSSDVRHCGNSHQTENTC